MGTARQSIQVDVGLGDAITPTPEEATYPTLLDMPAPRTKAYPRETAIAEKQFRPARLETLSHRFVRHSTLTAAAVAAEQGSAES